MARYVNTILFGWLVAAFWLMIYKVFKPPEVPDDPTVIMLLLGVGGIYTLLGVWGIVSVLIAQRQEELKVQLATISKSSWHYRMNRLVNDAWWTAPNSECQYWAVTANSLLLILPLEGVGLLIGWSIVSLVRIGGWLLGYVPSMTDFSSHAEVFRAEDRNAYRVVYKHQRVGPALLLGILVLVLVGLIRILFQETSWSLIAAVLLAATAAIVFRGVLGRLLGGGLKLFALILDGIAAAVRWIFSPIGGVISCALMRLAGFCRLVHYVD